MMIDSNDYVINTHPCFEGCCYGVRMHLPVAPECNLGCRYCNRKFDCINESRPGVSSSVITPLQARDRFAEEIVTKKVDVIGVAGPGDPLANYKKVLDTFCLIKNYCHKNAKKSLPFFCLSTNGLLLSEYLDELYYNGVSYYTITLNSLDENVSTMIYDYVKYKDVMLKNLQATTLLKKKQVEAFECLSKLKNVHIKINMVYIEGINDNQVLEIARFARNYRCDLLNIIPMIPVQNTPLCNNPSVNAEKFRYLKNKAEEIVPLMSHCRHCRADAIGTLL